MPASPFVWYKLMTSDLPAAETFYKAVVGGKPNPWGARNALRIRQGG